MNDDKNQDYGKEWEGLNDDVNAAENEGMNAVPEGNAENTGIDGEHEAVAGNGYAPVGSDTPPYIRKEKKKSGASATAVVIILAALLAGFIGTRLALVAVPAGDSTRAAGSGETTLVNTSTFAPEEVNAMEFMLLTTDVAFKESKDGNVLVEWYSNLDETLQQPTVNLSEGKMSVSEFFSADFNASAQLLAKGRGDSFMTVYLPKGIKMESMATSIVEGDIAADSNVVMDVRNMSLTSIAGDVDIPAVRAINLMVDSISGDVNLAVENDELEHIEVNSISGDCDITLPEGYKMNVSTNNISGEVEVSQALIDAGSAKTGVFSSVTGDLYITAKGE